MKDMKEVHLADLLSIEKGKKILPAEEPTSIRYIQIEDLRGDANLKWAREDQDVVACNEKDVLLAWDGANAGEFGYGLKGAVGSTLAKLSPLNGSTHTPYVGHFLKSKTPYLRSKCTGATIPHVNRRVLEDIKIPLPPLPEQRRIAAILDKAQALVANDKRTLAVYDQLAKSLFLEMFGDGNPDVREWPLVELKDLVSSAPNSLRSGPFGSDLLHSEFVDEGVAVLGIDNAVENRFSWKGRRFITHEKYNELKRYTVRPGDVLITIMATIGRSAVVPADIGPAINSKHLAAITLDQSKANPAFISFSIHSDERVIHQLFARSRGAIMSGLNLSLIKEVKLRLPPIDVQEHFCQALSRIERDKALATESLHQSEALFGSLLQGAFSGSLGR